MTALNWGVVLSGVYAIAALTFLVLKTRSWGQTPVFAVSQGHPIRGVAYALGRGLLPWEKESARLHLAAYLGGVAYHLGIFAAFAMMIILTFGIGVPLVVRTILRFGLSLGLAAGIGLLVKRILMPIARRLSRPDDFGANIFVDIFVAAALAASFQAIFVPAFLGYAIFLFLYIPLGKIRHCFFFFYSRIFFGLFFGRRGILPPWHSGTRP